MASKKEGRNCGRRGSVSHTTKGATVVNADEEFLRATEGMTDVDRVDFMVAYWFSIDHYPDQDHERFLPIWKRWQARKERKPA